MAMAIYFDTFLCTACKGCQVACKCWNNLPSDLGLNENKFSGSYQNPKDINHHTRLIMTFNELKGGPKGVRWAFGRRSCQHCTEAGCVEMCPSGALYHDESGMVTYDPQVCIGCQKCAAGCPFNVPRYDEVTGRINKCTGCVDRIDHGMEPACVATCQPDALKFGERSEMLALARERVAGLKERGFEDACLYGEDEMEGLHVIHVLKYGVEAHEQVPDPQLPPMVTATTLMKPITGVAAGATGLGLLGMFLMAVGYHRDKELYNEKTQDTIDADTGAVIKHGDGRDPLTVKEHLEAVPLFKRLFGWKKAAGAREGQEGEGDRDE